MMESSRGTQALADVPGGGADDCDVRAATSAHQRVNDNPEFLELMSAILDEEAGYDVTLFDGEEMSIEELAASDPDLLIVDLLMGGASGWEIVTLSRADARLSDRPILVCSADIASLREKAEELQRIGNVHILRSPSASTRSPTSSHACIGQRSSVTG